MGSTSSKATVPDSGNGQEGIIDHMFPILNKYNHPFILVGPIAHRWMGCNSCGDEEFDIVLRDFQFNEIVGELINTGRWRLFEAPKEQEAGGCEGDISTTPTEHELTPQNSYDTDIVLQQVGSKPLRFKYLKIWSEETYKIKVDNCPLVEVPELSPWNPYLAEKEQHPASGRDDGWWFGPSTLDMAEDSGPIFSPMYPRAKGSGNVDPIYIPAIPSYLDALVYHRTHYKMSKPLLYSDADWQISKLTKNLYLEVPHQKNAILFQVEAATENFLHGYLENYKRKPSHAFAGGGKLALVNRWDPNSYPDEVKRKWLNEENGSDWAKRFRQNNL